MREVLEEEVVGREVVVDRAVVDHEAVVAEVVRRTEVLEVVVVDVRDVVVVEVRTKAVPGEVLVEVAEGHKTEAQGVVVVAGLEARTSAEAQGCRLHTQNTLDALQSRRNYPPSSGSRTYWRSPSCRTRRPPGG